MEKTDELVLLIVDDSAPDRFLARIAARNLPVRAIYEAENATVGLESLETHPDINLIFSDVNMPGINGYEFVEAIRRAYSERQIQIFLMSSEIDARKAMEAGVDRMIPKGLVLEYYINLFKEAC